MPKQSLRRRVERRKEGQFRQLIATLIVVGFYAAVIGLLLGTMSVTDNQAVMLLLGAMISAMGTVISFYFGSSTGSEKKTELMSRTPEEK